MLGVHRGRARAAMVNRVCPICLRPSPGGKEHPACSRALYGSATSPQLAVGLGDIERLAVETVNRRLALTGVQRKLSLSFIGSGVDRRLTIVGALGGSHILKPPAPEYPGMPELEHWTMVLARATGLRTAEAGLIPLSSGELAFITKRFDREGSRRIHVEDLCQLSGLATEQKYRSSMEKVGTLVRNLATAPGDDALRLLEVTLFSFLVGNSDMHLKNWTLVRDAGRVALSPAYDLLPVRLLVDDPEEFALPINGRKNRLKRGDFEALAKHLKIPDIVTRRTIDDLPARLMQALERHPSPWLVPEQAKAFNALVERSLAQLGHGHAAGRQLTRAPAAKRPTSRRSRPHR
jgi:serine/threonine-protein kinase HipA